MGNSLMRKPSERKSEHGGARAKLILFLAFSALVVYAGIMYVPVAWKARQFKDMMQTKVDLAGAQGNDANWLREQIVRSATEFDVPPDAKITAQLNDGRLEAKAQFVWPISFPGYTYEYEFNETIKGTQFLTGK